MLTLLVFRHAKAEHDDSLGDEARRLTHKGRKAARRMGELARELALLPELLLSSSSVRTRETVELFVEGSAYDGPVKYLPSLYLGEPSAYLEALAEHAAAVPRVMVVGHNPGLEGLVMELTGERVTLPTAALAECALSPESFSEIRTGEGELRRILGPKDE